MEVIITYFTSNFNALKKHWEQKSILRNQGVMGTNEPLNVDLGGLVRILNWETKEIVKDFKLDRPSGIANDEDSIFIFSGGNQINVFDYTFRLKGIISSNYLNCGHTISRTNHGILVSSSGLDLILEIDFEGNSLYEWWAIDHGFYITPLKERRIINKHIDHRFTEYPTLSQTTHVNSAIYDHDNSQILATLFHQGYLIQIDKLTSSFQIVLKGLSCPHSVYRLPYGGYLVSDTKAGRVLVLDDWFKIKQEIKVDSDWIQDTIYTPQGTYLVADSNNFRIVEVSEEGEVVDEYRYESNLKVSQVAILYI